EIHEQRRRQRSVHDEARIALHVHRPRPVVVDAVAVEGERREAEEQHRIRRDAAPPRHVGRRRLAARRLVALARFHFFAEDRAPLVLPGQDAVPAQHPPRDPAQNPPPPPPPLSPTTPPP